jgi:hypothetical protein
MLESVGAQSAGPPTAGGGGGGGWTPQWVLGTVTWVGQWAATGMWIRCKWWGRLVDCGCARVWVGGACGVGEVGEVGCERGPHIYCCCAYPPLAPPPISG